MPTLVLTTPTNPGTASWTDSTLIPTVPSGPAGGDLSGTYPNPQVAGLEGYPIEAAPPVAGDALIFNGIEWAHTPFPSGAFNFQGTWDANTNTPDIAVAPGLTQGWTWYVSVAGNTNLGGINVWDVGDLAVYGGGGVWFKIDNTGWETAGNTVGAGQFVGSTNNADLVFKRNNLTQLTLTSTGLLAAAGLDMANNVISNIGAAGTDFTATGGLTLADTLTVSAGGAGVTGAVTQSGGEVSFTPTTSVQIQNGKQLRLYEPSGSGVNYTALQAQAQAADVTLTLPAAQGAAGTVLSNDGTGLLSWSAPSSVSWSLSGNTLAGGEFLGSTNAQDVVLKRNNVTQLTLGASGLLAATGLDMANNLITNIGNAGTDFTAGGGLTLASTLTVSAGGASITGATTIATGGGNLSISSAGASTISLGATNLTLGATIGSIGIGTWNLAAQTITASGNLSFSGADVLLSPTNALEIRAAKQIRWNNAGNTFYTSFQAPALAANVSYTLPLAQGAASTFLRNDGTGVLSWAAAGLTFWTESQSTAAPNNVVPAAQLQPSNAAADVDAVLAPKGVGAVQAQIADNTAAGGNKRGIYATDWQHNRTAAARVAAGSNSTIGGGVDNQADAVSSTVAGGDSNIINTTRNYGTIGGGQSNQIFTAGTHGTIAGGQSNEVRAQHGTVGGGQDNDVYQQHATVGGGWTNTINSTYGTIGGGAANRILGTSSSFATIGGGGGTIVGYGNTINNNSNYATISGGLRNQCSTTIATVGGGENNHAAGAGSTIAGGATNLASQAGTTFYSAIGGGSEHYATGNYCTISGGWQNEARGDYTFVGGGRTNVAAASRTFAFIGGGAFNGINTAGSYGIIVGGSSNLAQNSYATIVGGSGHTASAQYSFIGSGASNSVSRDYGTIAGGQSNTISTAGTHQTIGGGQSNTVTAAHSSIPGGLQASTRYIGEVAHASGQFAALGDAQDSSLVARLSVAVGGNGILTLDGLAASAANTIVLSNNSMLQFTIKVAARDTGATGNFAWWHIVGGIKRDGSDVTTALVGANVVDTGNTGAPASGWTVNAVANAAVGAGSLDIQVSAPGGTGPVRFVASVYLTRVA